MNLREGRIGPINNERHWTLVELRRVAVGWPLRGGQGEILGEASFFSLLAPEDGAIVPVSGAPEIGLLVLASLANAWLMLYKVNLAFACA